MDLLEPYIRSGLGIALRASNGKYVSRIRRGHDGWVTMNIEAAKSYKDPHTKFIVEPIGWNHIRVKSAVDGKYLSVIHRHRGIQWIEAIKSNPDDWCTFQAFEVDGKLVLKNWVNQRYLSRINRDQPYIEAAKYGIDEHCKFIVESGAILPVREEIIGLRWGNANNIRDLQPSIVRSKTVNNEGSETAEMDITMEWSFTEHSETMWEHGWGITMGISYTHEFRPFPGIGFGSSVEFNLELNYNGKKGGNRGRSKTTQISETTRVRIPPGKKVTAFLVVQKKDDAEVPFEATIRRTSEIGTFTFTERGTWKGVMKFDSHVTIEESDL